MNSIDNDLARVENEIARANPVPFASLPSADSPYARRIIGKVLAAPARATRRVAMRDDPTEPPANLRSGGLPPWLIHGRAAKLAVTAAAIVAIAAVTVSQLLAGSQVRNRGAVTDTLTALAGVAAKRPAVRPPGHGQYQYTDSVSRGLEEVAQYRRPFEVSHLLTRQIWIGWNGSGRIAEASSDPRFPTPSDRAAWIADGRPHLSAGGHFDQRFGRGGLTLGPVNEWKLPTDVARLGAMLRKRAIEGGPPGPHEDFVQVGDLLRETDAPPALRAALFKVAASIPGVRILGRITDRLGRTGIVVAYLDRPPAGKYAGMYGLDELIFAQKTSALLDEQTVLVDTRAHTRRITSWTAYIATGVVNSVTAVAPPYGRIATSTKPA